MRYSSHIMDFLIDRVLVDTVMRRGSSSSPSQSQELMLSTAARRIRAGSLARVLAVAPRCLSSDIKAGRHQTPIVDKLWQRRAEARKKQPLRKPSSRFTGVCAEVGGRWQARVPGRFTVDGKQKHLGYFTDEEDAARAVDDELAEHGQPRVNSP